MRKIIGMAVAAFLSAGAMAQAQPAREKIIIDTDIGDDIDDAFAVALALSSPEFDVLGFSADFGDTPARARMLDRMLGEMGHSDIPVAMGTPVDVNRNAFTQRAYAEGGASRAPAIPIRWISCWARPANIPARSPWSRSGRCPMSAP